MVEVVKDEIGLDFDNLELFEVILEVEKLNFKLFKLEI